MRTACLKSRRWEFIRLLEEGSLLACSSCLKLHPFTELRPNQIVFKDHDSRVCHLGYYSGFIDLCPCVKMTFRDKLQLVDEWKRFLASKPKSADARYFWHRCSRSYMGATVTYQTIIFSRFGVNGSLILDIDYTFKFEGPAWVLSHLERRVCPHHSLFEFITFEVPCPFPGTPDYIVSSAEHGCPICQTTVPSLECRVTGGFTFL